MTIQEHFKIRHPEYEKPEEAEPAFLVGWHTLYFRKCKTVEKDAMA